MDGIDSEHGRAASHFSLFSDESDQKDRRDVERDLYDIYLSDKFVGTRHVGNMNSEAAIHDYEYVVNDTDSNIWSRNRMPQKATTSENGMTVMTEQVVGYMSDLNTVESHSMNAFVEDCHVSTEGAGSPKSLDQMELALLTPPKSVIHCALCQNIFTEPKILDCLHTFCQFCLELRRKYLRHKMIFCPICHFNTDLPKGGICNLPTNPVIANMINFNSVSRLPVNCVICQLHGAENKGTHRCVDCGDVMCNDCCGKHTFSRHTAKHTVVSLEHIQEDIFSLVRNQLSPAAKCKQHPSEEANFYCENCLKPVCQDCILIKHNTHQCVDLGKAVERIKCDILSKLDALQTMIKELDVNDHSEIELIKKREKEEIEVLDGMRCKLIWWIESKVEKCKHDLEVAFQGRKNFCETQQKYINDRKRDLAFLKSNVDFFLKDEHSAELSLMEALIKQRIETLEAKIISTFSRLTYRSRFPSVVMLEYHMKLVESLDLFKVESGKIKSRENSSKNKKKFSNDRKDNQEILKGKRVSKEMDFKHQSSIPPVKLQDVRKGRSREIADNLSKTKFGGSGFQGDRPMGIHYLSAGLLANISYKKSSRGSASSMLLGQAQSLLGDYPGQIGHSFARGHSFGTTSATSDPFFQHLEYCLQPQTFPCNQDKNSSRSSQSIVLPCSRKESHKKSQKGQQEHLLTTSVTPVNVLDLISENFWMKLHSRVTIRVVQDHQEPHVTGLTYISDQDFAVSDASNMKVKMFSSCGKFQNFASDPGPMSLTFVAKKLIWNSQNSKIKVYSLQQSRLVTIRNVSATSTHPLTSFKNEKYLVANINKANIEACKIDGKNALVIEPHDSDGNTLSCVTHIAANTADQLVMADSASKKVVVNNFEGKCIGEYMADDLCVGGMCVDERHHIYVTDSARNKLILLSPKAKFIREWTTYVEDPTCVSCNGKGRLIVAGKGSNIYLYQYFHE